MILLGLFSCLSFFSCKEFGKTKKQISKTLDSFYKDSSSYKTFPKPIKDSIEKLFKTDFSGTVLVYKKGFLFQSAYGHRDFKQKKEIELNDIFQLASVSKTVTAVAVLQLCQKNLIHLDSMFSKYVEDFPYKNVSIRHLLSHRSGLANYIYYTDTFWKDNTKMMNNKDLYTFFKTIKPLPYLMPDVSFSYNNTNFALLPILIEKITKLSFQEYVKTNIFMPAGMKFSYFKGHQPKYIKGKELLGRFEKVVYSDPYYLDEVLGDKSMMSNVNDMFLFYKGLKKGVLLNDSFLKLMQTPSYKHNIYGGSYGLGFRIKKIKDEEWVYHNGWWKGFWTFFWTKMDEDVCIVVLTNNRKSSRFGIYSLSENLSKFNPK